MLRVFLQTGREQDSHQVIVTVPEVTVRGHHQGGDEDLLDVNPAPDAAPQQEAGGQHHQNSVEETVGGLHHDAPPQKTRIF